MTKGIIVGIYTIGQTPRPDLTLELHARFPAVHCEVRGALDGLEQSDLPRCRPDGYPLETRMRDGARVVVEAAFLEPLIQGAITRLDPSVTCHFLLCAGHFPSLSAGRALLQPFEVARAELAARGVRSLELVVPFAAQASSALSKWRRADFVCRAHVLGEQAGDASVALWLSDRLAGTSAEAVVFDYVGFPSAILEDLRERIDLPVFDLGHLGLDALERALEAI